MGLTVDEAKAGAIQVVVLQVVIPGTAVSASQHLFPARHGSDKGEVIAPALPAQNGLGLAEGRKVSQATAPLLPAPSLLLEVSSPCPPQHGSAGCC